MTAQGTDSAFAPPARRITVHGCTLHCEVSGAGPPVLFVHGFPLTGEMWRATAAGLCDRWRCIVPDLRGHGRSDATPQTSIAQFADDLAALLDELDERRPAVVVGLSLGGIIAFEFFRRHRPRLRALVLTCTRANPENAEGIARREALAQAALTRGTAAVVDTMIDNLFAPGVDPALKRRWREIMCTCPPVGTAAAARALAARADSYPTLPQIDVPTLVVAGAEDAITPVATLREIHAGIRGSRLEIIPRAGHLPPVEQPEAYAAAVRRFLETVGCVPRRTISAGGRV